MIRYLLCAILVSIPVVLVMAAVQNAFGGTVNATENMKNEIRIENVRADVPQFKRIYKSRLDARASITITIRNSYFGDTQRMKSGELTQPNGRWILFDPDAIADKILDPTLVPLVQKCVNDIYALDRDFMKSNPNEFTDERGNKWQRIK